MRKDLLLRLADALEADAKNPNGVKFDLSTWAVPSKTLELPLYERTYPTSDPTVDVNCNTAACAMGFAAISGLFEKEGLSYYLEDIDLGRWQLIPRYTNQVDEPVDGFKAAEHLFEIGFHTSCDLFEPTRYQDRREPTSGAESELIVAKRIRDLVNSN